MGFPSQGCLLIACWFEIFLRWVFNRCSFVWRYTFEPWVWDTWLRETVYLPQRLSEALLNDSRANDSTSNTMNESFGWSRFTIWGISAVGPSLIRFLYTLPTCQSSLFISLLLCYSFHCSDHLFSPLSELFEISMPLLPSYSSSLSLDSFPCNQLMWRKHRAHDQNLLRKHKRRTNQTMYTADFHSFRYNWNTSTKETPPWGGGSKLHHSFVASSTHVRVARLERSIGESNRGICPHSCPLV